MPLFCVKINIIINNVLISGNNKQKIIDLLSKIGFYMICALLLIEFYFLVIPDGITCNKFC